MYKTIGLICLSFSGHIITFLGMFYKPPDILKREIRAGQVFMTYPLERSIQD